MDRCLDCTVGVVGVLRKELKEGPGEWGGSVVVCFDEGVDFADNAIGCNMGINCVVVARVAGWLGGFVRVGFVRWIAACRLASPSFRVWSVGEWWVGWDGNIPGWFAWANLVLNWVSPNDLTFLLSWDAAVINTHASQRTRAHGPLLAGIAVALEGFSCGADVALLNGGDCA